MSKSVFMRALLVGLSLFISVGVALMAYMIMDSFNTEVMRVDLDAGGGTVEFENLCLIPGESCEYTVSLESDMASECSLTLDFDEIEEKDLKNYAYARLELNGEVVRDQLLKTLIESGDVVLDADFTESDKIELKIVYYLPAEVGNEAQNAEALFNLKITADNIG